EDYSLLNDETSHENIVDQIASVIAANQIT
ncbi:deoxynucleoside kinase, partial [Bacillus vallismortis]|nr:deoxynucleoside kinase [Bacillus vallismortis]